MIWKTSGLNIHGNKSKFCWLFSLISRGRSNRALIVFSPPLSFLLSFHSPQRHHRTQPFGSLGQKARSSSKANCQLKDPLAVCRIELFDRDKSISLETSVQRRQSANPISQVYCHHYPLFYLVNLLHPL